MLFKSFSYKVEKRQFVSIVHMKSKDLSLCLLSINLSTAQESPLSLLPAVILYQDLHYA